MRNIYIAAGGTGGHINAALSLGEKLKENYNVTFISGQRHLDYKLFQNTNCVHIGSRALRSKNPLKLIYSAFLNALVFLKILILFIQKKPAFVIGAGGYVCGPTLMAAWMCRKPLFIIEQNAVVGMTNKILSTFASRIYTNFSSTKGLSEKVLSKVKSHGNPIRQNITFSENVIGDEINILIFGGSLGATQINSAINRILSNKFNPSVNVLHQVGKGNIFTPSDVDKSINYKQVEYIDDMDKQYKWANIIISRAGASTISELRVVKKPAILIPYPAAVDNHQFYNAQNLKNENLAYVEVIDHSQSIEQVANDIYSGLVKIMQENLFYSDKRVVNNAVDAIVADIESYVWNK